MVQILPKLLLDENIGVLTAAFLRLHHFDVLSIIEEKPGASDEIVLQLASKANRILITLDKDFGSLVYQHSQKHVGVIFLRLKDESADKLNNVLLNILETYSDQISQTFITVTDDSVRIR